MVGTSYHEEDVMITPMPGGELVTACDSFGGIGNKSQDSIPLHPYQVGRYAAFVPFVEVISRGAKPFLLVNTLAVEMEPTGREIIRGIRSMAHEAGLSESAITGSTEDNIVSVQTGVGVTVMGWRQLSEKPLEKTNTIYYVYGVGKPKMGQQFLEEEIIGHKKETMTLEHLYQVMDEPGYVSLLSVGSKGMLYEAKTLAKRHQCSFVADKKGVTWLEASAGPGTCSVVAFEKPLDEQRIQLYSLPVYPIGKFIPK